MLFLLFGIVFSYPGCSNINLGSTNQQANESLQQYEAGYRFDRNGWIYLHIQGEPYDRDYQHGYLVAQELEEILRSLKYLTYR